MLLLLRIVSTRLPGITPGSQIHVGLLALGGVKVVPESGAFGRCLARLEFVAESWRKGILNSPITKQIMDSRKCLDLNVL